MSLENKIAVLTIIAMIITALITTAGALIGSAVSPLISHWLSQPAAAPTENDPKETGIIRRVAMSVWLNVALIALSIVPLVLELFVNPLPLSRFSVLGIAVGVANIYWNLEMIARRRMQIAQSFDRITVYRRLLELIGNDKEFVEITRGIKPAKALIVIIGLMLIQPP